MVRTLFACVGFVVGFSIAVALIDVHGLYLQRETNNLPISVCALEGVVLGFLSSWSIRWAKRS